MRQRAIVAGERVGRQCAAVIALALAGVALLSVTACDSPQEPATKVIAAGRPLPPLRLTDIRGDEALLEARPGRVMVLNVWATWCGPCRRELPSLQRLADLLGEDGYEVVGVALDEDLHHVREYLHDKGVTYRNYLDIDRSRIESALGITAVPATLFVDTEGKVNQVIIGPREWDDAGIVSELSKLRK